MNTNYYALACALGLLLAALGAQAQPTLFVMNFTVNGEKETKMGQTVAGSVEQGLRCCGCQYTVIQRFSVERAGSPGPELDKALAQKEVDYLLQGDIHELSSDGLIYQVDYRIEERQTMSTVAVGTFEAHRDALLDAPSCETALSARFSLDDGLCKNKVISSRTLRAGKSSGDAPPQRDSGQKTDISASLSGDDDGDGVINALDVEPHTAAGALVDRNGRAVDPSSFVYLKKVKEELKENLPALPWVDFEGTSTELPMDAQSALIQVATWMRHYPNMIVAIEGHDPLDGVRAYDRAKAVRRWLTENQGLQAQRFRLRYDVGSHYTPRVDLSFDLSASNL